MSKFKTTASEMLLYRFFSKSEKMTSDLIPFLKLILKGKLQGFFSSPFEFILQHGMSP